MTLIASGQGTRVAAYRLGTAAARTRIVRTRSSIVALRIVPVLALMLLAGCDSAPSGPGAILARAAAPSLGGVLLDVHGSGIDGFTARGTTQVYSAAVPGSTDRHRVILIDRVGGDLGFDIVVQDLGMEDPVITVVQATRTDNAMISSAGVVVTLER